MDNLITKPYEFIKKLNTARYETDFYNSLMSIDDIPMKVILILIKKINNDSFNVSNYRTVYTELLTNQDCFFVFKNIKDGKEFYALYDYIWEECNFGYCTENGEIFDNNFTISSCIKMFNKNFMFSFSI